MKRHKLAGSICALLIAALGTASATAQTSSVATILFTRTQTRAIDGAYGKVLYRVNPSGAGIAQLSPLTYGVDYRGGRWSPSGTAVVYEGVQQPSPPHDTNSQLYVVDRQGGSSRQITTGSDQHSLASWGPTSGTIAFVNATYRTDLECLGAVGADGTNQRILFCPPSESGVSKYVNFSLPQWTADGKSVYVDVGATEGGLEPKMWYSRVYRVNVSTGAAVMLTEQVFTDAGGSQYRQLAISPDGTHGVYDGSPMYAIDFTTNTRRQLSTSGVGPVYSHDGSKIAFTKQDAAANGYSRVFVMNADGSHIHRALANPDPNATYYSVADWSFDGTRLLVNKMSDIGDYLPLQIIDLRNNTATSLTTGTAEKGAWFHP